MRYTIQDIKSKFIAIRIKTIEEGTKVIKELGFKYSGNFPFLSYEDFCIAPFRKTANADSCDGSICHCRKSYYEKNHIIIEFSQIDFNEIDVLNSIEIY